MMETRAKQALCCLIYNSMDVLRNTLLFLGIANCASLSEIISKASYLIILSQPLRDYCLYLEKNYLSAFDARTNCSVIKINFPQRIRRATNCSVIKLTLSAHSTRWTIAQWSKLIPSLKRLSQYHLPLNGTCSVPRILFIRFFLFIIFISFGGGSVVSHGIA